MDLFSGIGGFSLGLESAGFETVAFCEIEAFPCKVLAKHWPDVPIYNDVTELTGDRLKADGIAIDVITAGFPCQDISHAGKGAGIKEGTRSGLWSEVARLTGELRPQYLILENVAAILGRGADIVLGDLAEIGYDAEWHCIPASAVGAPHRRDRWWCVAHPNEQRCTNRGNRLRPVRFASRLSQSIKAGPSAGQWTTEPSVGRVANGIPKRVDRLKGLGNAVVPQIPAIIGQAIMELENQ